MAAPFLVPPPHVMALRHEEAACRAKRRKQRQWRRRQAQARAITFRRLGHHGR